jgi:quinol monooxygenase YgiN
LISYRAQPGREEAAKGELKSLIATVVAEEPGCLGISMLEDAADPAKILLHERWTDKATFVGPHMQTPHLKAFVQRAPQLFTGAPETSFWNEVAAV